jgi:DNA mismatch repair protein MutL
MGPEAHIRILPAHVANKIAAGEVVERPASVVKELVENSLDADASQVDVDITAGGRKLVAVRDNGRGMSRDDALLSIERQATSKIRDVDDIERINTLGFRGEALAAIASASRFRMVTCARGNDAGTEVLVLGGKIEEVRDIGCPSGTSVEARDLFHNIPARRKFLRSYQTELGHIRAVFIQQALAHPAIGMSLKVDGREVYRLPADSTFEDRLRNLFGPDYIRNLKPVDHTTREVKVSGYVSMPAIHRADRNEQYVFVNGRVTSAPLIGYAIREGYRTLLPRNRHPSVFLFVDLDPGLVDVNVHPAKREVRFRRTSAVRDGVIDATRAALSTDGAALPAPGRIGPDRPDVPVQRPTATVQMHIENLPRTTAFKYPRMPAADQGPLTDTSRPPAPAPQDRQAAADRQLPADNFSSPWAWCRVVGMIGNTYVVLETEEGYVLMDPHAAHERVLFERFMRDVADGKVASQSLLMPETVEMNPRDAVRVRQHLAMLKDMGFGISEFGGDSFVVDALPACFGEAPARPMLIEVSSELEKAGSRGRKGRWEEESVAQAACRAAVRARDKLTLEEIEQLVVDLARTEMPYTCPHGRPTLIFTSFSELDRKFGRA